MSKDYKLEIYKLIKGDNDVSRASEYGWVNDSEFLVWIDYSDVGDFMAEATKVFGYSLFDDGGFDVRAQADGICFDLNKMLEGYGLELEDIFPKDENEH